MKKNLTVVLILTSIFLIFFGISQHWLLRFWIELIPFSKEVSTLGCDNLEQENYIAPTISFLNLTNFQDKVSAEIIPEILITEAKAISLESISINLVVPSAGYYKYSIASPEVRVEEVESGLKLYLDTNNIPPADPMLLAVKFQDCGGNVRSSVIAASTATNFNEHFWGFYTYLLLYGIWFVTIFSPLFRRNPWGTVYDSVSGTPLARAIVRLYNLENQLIETAVTNVKGVFRFTPPEGTYRILVSRAEYSFPSKLVSKTGRSAKGLYFGDTIEVKNDNQAIKVRVPLDPKGKPSSGVFTKRFADTFQNTVIMSQPGVLLISAVLEVLLWPIDPMAYLISLFSLSLFLIQLFFVKRSEGKPGRVLTKTGKPVPDIELGLYEPEFNQLVDRVKTNSKGEFIFIAHAGNYEVRVLSGRYVISDKQSAQISVKSKEAQLIAPTIEVTESIPSKT